jgi:hypothetical protein
MNPRSILRPAALLRAAATLLVALAPLATGACLLPACGFWTNLFGPSDCSVAYANAQFSSNASYVVQEGSAADTVILTSGWVYVSPLFADGDQTPVYVQTTYVVAGSDTPGGPGHPLPARVDSTVVENDGSSLASYFVMAFTSGTTLDSTVVALVTGSLLNVSLPPGCQVTYYQNATASAPIPFSQTVQDTLTSIQAPFTPASSC